MSRFYFPLLIISLAFSVVACDSNSDAVPTRTITNQLRELPPFTEIDVSANITTKISFGPEQSVRVQLDEAVRDRVLTRVDNGRLIIERTSRSSRNLDHEVTIVLPELKRLDARDFCLVSLDGFVDLSSLDLNITDRVFLDVTNSVASNLTANISDNSMVRAFGLSADDVTANVDRDSFLEITANSTLTGTVNWLSIIRYRGNPVETVTRSEAGRVDDWN